MLLKRQYSLVIAFILLIVGLLFVTIDFISPHATLTEVPVQETRSLGSLDGFHLNGYPPETLQQSADNIYRSIAAVNITNGQTLKVSWYSDIFLGVFIFWEEQFAYFQSILSNMQSPERVDAAEWANVNGITHEARGWANRNGRISYNVTETGNCVAVITNAMYGAAYAYISDFDLDLISYSQTTQEQSDSLYLYVGILLMILGIAQVALIFFRRNRLSFRKG